MMIFPAKHRERIPIYNNGKEKATAWKSPHVGRLPWKNLIVGAVLFVLVYLFIFGSQESLSDTFSETFYDPGNYRVYDPHDPVPAQLDDFVDDNGKHQIKRPYMPLGRDDDGSYQPPRPPPEQIWEAGEDYAFADLERQMKENHDMMMLGDTSRENMSKFHEFKINRRPQKRLPVVGTLESDPRTLELQHIGRDGRRALCGTEDENECNHAQVAAVIKRMTQHAWAGYVKYAWGENELKPLAKEGTNDLYGGVKVGATIVDALSTLIIMELKDEVLQARDFIANDLDYGNLKVTSATPAQAGVREGVRSLRGGMVEGQMGGGQDGNRGQARSEQRKKQNPKRQGDSAAIENQQMKNTGEQTPAEDWNFAGVSVFETIIRMVGGLVSAHSLTGDELFLATAADITDRLAPAFHTKTGIPMGEIDFTRRKARKSQYHPKDIAGLSEFSTLSLEFRYLSGATGDEKYISTSDHIRNFLYRNVHPRGLLPSSLDYKKGIWKDKWFTLGGMADSTYEYLLKEWVMSGFKDDSPKHFYDLTLPHMIEYLVMEQEAVALEEYGFAEVVPEKKAMKELGFESWIYLAENNARKGILGSVKPQMEHLACFAGGMFAMGAYYSLMHNVPHIPPPPPLDPLAGGPPATDRPSELVQFELGREVTRTCRASYVMADSGLGAERLVFGVPRSPSDEEKEKQRNRKRVLRKRRVVLGDMVGGAPEDDDNADDNEDNMDLDQNNDDDRGNHEFEGGADFVVGDDGDEEDEWDGGELAMPDAVPFQVDGTKPAVFNARAFRGMRSARSRLKAKTDMIHQYILRPETLESYYYMWRLTRNEMYREWALDVVVALNRWCLVPSGGYTGLHNTYQSAGEQNVLYKDVMQSFFLAETLKYLFLMFAEDDQGQEILSLEHWVLNTEAHPLPIEGSVADGSYPWRFLLDNRAVKVDTNFRAGEGVASQAGPGAYAARTKTFEELRTEVVSQYSKEYELRKAELDDEELKPEARYVALDQNTIDLRKEIRKIKVHRVQETKKATKAKGGAKMDGSGAGQPEDEGAQNGRKRVPKRRKLFQ
eukprot:Clim_evm69s22 gene=Clim_evmTU69s22